MANNNPERRDMSREEKEFYRIVGDNLRVIIKAKGYRQLDFALKAGVPYSTLINYLDGARRLNLYKYSKIMDALELTDVEKLVILSSKDRAHQQINFRMDIFNKINLLPDAVVQKIEKLIDNSESELYKDKK